MMAGTGAFYSYAAGEEMKGGGGLGGVRRGRGRCSGTVGERAAWHDRTWPRWAQVAHVPAE
jgi:hypothetical protein